MVSAIAGRGVAARVDADVAPALLAAIERDDTVGEPGCGPVALGVLPFLPGAPAELIIPQRARRQGARRPPVDHDHRRRRTRSDGATAAPPRRLRLLRAPGIDPKIFLDAVVTGRDAVRAGDLTKVVIARDIVVESDEPMNVHAILLRLRASFGSSYRYSVDGFVGASPELLVARHGAVVRSHPLAGTTARTGDPATDTRLAAELIASMKNQVEHRVVIDVVHDTLLPYASYLDWEPEPSIVTVANVQHLGTRMEGRLSDPPANVLHLARLLSPTPALGGHPRHAAIELIGEIEGMERGRYGGAVGWLDADGNGTWAVAIRCAELTPDRRTARLFAGCGIVAESDPWAELAETQAKFQAMLSAIVRA